MEKLEILRQLAAPGLLPIAAIEAARLQKDVLSPEFIGLIEAHAAGSGNDSESRLLLLAFHLLGEWGETRSYEPLVRLLRSPAAERLDDALMETSHRVILRVFDGDPSPLRDLVLDTQADEFARSRMLEALALLARSGEIRRDEAAAFLRGCVPAFEAEPAGFVWYGWQSAVAILGLEDLVPFVRDAFARELIDSHWLSYSNFETDFRELRAAELPLEFRPFEDTIAEFSNWYGFTQAFLDDQEEALKRPPWFSQEPAINVHRRVGRNDPCPCGSGKKFKRCCLAEAA